ncbi:MAG TPA: CAP domain-containing protein [Acidimicrobiales bacterium]|nr:CAP domain-containing protein [Acidimicrobiales bacterium]
MSARRRFSPARLMLGFVVACLAPLAAVAATDMGRDGGPGADRVETAAAGRRDVAGSAATTGTTLPPSTAEPPTTPAPDPTEATAAPTTGTPPPTSAPAPPAPSPADQVLARTNKERAAAGCGPVQPDPRLAAAAQAHSDDMANRNFFSHTTPEGTTFDARIKAAGYPAPGGENIAQGQRTATEVMDDWLESAGHRKNILTCEFTAMGVGYNAPKRIWTQTFGY